MTNKRKTETTGTVYLVGAGPGDPGLISVKGLELISKADVVIYDYLASEQLLKHTRPDAEIVYVGKKASQHTLSQGKINKLLIEKAKTKQTIVRLKGGDPFIFGRGGEEAIALFKAGIPCEVVPGITSGIAAAAYAGIPLTHRDFASDVAFVTGHEDARRSGPSRIDWKSLGKWKGTLVFFMGVKNLPDICRNLHKHGLADDTPAAIIRWGSTPRQQTVVGTLATLPELARQRKIKPPAITVIGKVIELRKNLCWFEKLPLFGRRIIVTRSRVQASVLSRQLESLGAEVLECPTIRIEPPENIEPLNNAVIELPNYNWIIFTSTNAVAVFFDTLYEHGLDSRRFARCRICTIGPATAAELNRYGINADIIPEKFVAEAIVQAFDRHHEDMTGQKVLLPRADIARDDLPQLLQAMGADVNEVTAYRTVLDDTPKEEIIRAIQDDTIDWITFTSSSTVRNFFKQIDLHLLSGKKLRLASIGPITSDTIEQMGLQPAVQAEEYTIPGLVKAVCRIESNS